MKKMDMVIIGSLLVLALLSLLAIEFYRSRPFDARIVEIKVDGQLIESFEWTEGLEKEIEVDTEFGYNRIRVESGGLFMEYADCPDQVCVRDGRIDSPGELLVCLPHRLIVEIKGEKKEDEIDDFSY